MYDRPLGTGTGFDELGPILQAVPNWTPESCFCTERQASLLKNHIAALEEDGVLASTARDLEKAKASLKEAVKNVSYAKRLEKGSDAGTGIRGAKYVKLDLERMQNKTLLYAKYKQELYLCERGLEIYAKATELRAAREAEQEAERLRRDAKQLEGQFRKLCQAVPSMAKEIIDQVMNNPWSTSPNIIDHPAIPFVLGRGMKHLSTMRRYLSEVKGARGLPEVPETIKAPRGFADNLEKILGRRLNKAERSMGIETGANRVDMRALCELVRGRGLGPTEVVTMARFMSWDRVLQQFAALDARLALEKLERGEAEEAVTAEATEE